MENFHRYSIDCIEGWEINFLISDAKMSMALFSARLATRSFSVWTPAMTKVKYVKLIKTKLSNFRSKLNFYKKTIF